MLSPPATDPHRALVVILGYHHSMHEYDKADLMSFKLDSSLKSEGPSQVARLGYLAATYVVYCDAYHL